MASAPNQFLMYDSAVSEWAHNNFGSLISDPTHFTIGTPDLGFAEYITTTTHTPREGRPPLPRCAITIEDPEIDDTRFNPNVIRKLGFTSNSKLKIYRAYYPVPVNLHYTINFWTEKYREMNLFSQKVMQLFKAQHCWIKVDVDAISPTPLYGTKIIELEKDGALVNTGDVEPNKGERQLRRTFSFIAKAWIWDFDIQQASIIKQIELQTYRDRDLTLLAEIISTPQREQLGFANGTSTSYNLNSSRLPIVENTLIVDAIVGGQIVRGTDDGEGNIIDTVTQVVSGSVDYSTGHISLNYTVPPDASSAITSAFYTKR